MRDVYIPDKTDEMKDFDNETKEVKTNEFANTKGKDVKKDDISKLLEGSVDKKEDKKNEEFLDNQKRGKIKLRDRTIINPGNKSILKILKFCGIILVLGIITFFGVQSYNKYSASYKLAKQKVAISNLVTEFLESNNLLKKENKIVFTSEKQRKKDLEIKKNTEEKLTNSIFGLEEESNSGVADYGTFYITQTLNRYMSSSSYEAMKKKFSEDLENGIAFIDKKVFDIKKEKGKLVRYKEKDYLLSKSGFVVLFKSNNKEDILIIKKNINFIYDYYQNEILKSDNIIVDTYKIIDELKTIMEDEYNVQMDIFIMTNVTTEKI